MKLRKRLENELCLFSNLSVWHQASRVGCGVFTEVNWLKLRYILNIMIWYSSCSQKMLYVLSFLVLFLHFRRKTRLIKWASVCVCVQFWSTPNNFHTSYAIDTKCWLHIVSYRNSLTPLIPFLNFENCARVKFLKFIFSPFN